MYVIAEIQGQQFKAEEGKKLYVHHIQNVEANATVEIEKVLLVDNNGEIKVGAPTVEGAKVVLEVISPLVKGDKVLVFHKRRRKGYRKLRGHREQLTQVLVKSIVAYSPVRHTHIHSFTFTNPNKTVFTTWHIKKV